MKAKIQLWIALHQVMSSTPAMTARPAYPGR